MALGLLPRLHLGILEVLAAVIVGVHARISLLLSALRLRRWLLDLLLDRLLLGQFLAALQRDIAQLGTFNRIKPDLLSFFFLDSINQINAFLAIQTVSSVELQQVLLIIILVGANREVFALVLAQPVDEEIARYHVLPFLLVSMCTSEFV